MRGLHSHQRPRVRLLGSPDRPSDFRQLAKERALASQKPSHYATAVPPLRAATLLALPHLCHVHNLCTSRAHLESAREAERSQRAAQSSERRASQTAAGVDPWRGSPHIDSSESLSHRCEAAFSCVSRRQWGVVSLAAESTDPPNAAPGPHHLAQQREFLPMPSAVALLEPFQRRIYELPRRVLVVHANASPAAGARRAQRRRPFCPGAAVVLSSFTRAAASQGSTIYSTRNGHAHAHARPTPHRTPYRYTEEDPDPSRPYRLSEAPRAAAEASGGTDTLYLVPCTLYRQTVQVTDRDRGGRESSEATEPEPDGAHPGSECRATATARDGA